MEEYLNRIYCDQTNIHIHVKIDAVKKIQWDVGVGAGVDNRAGDGIFEFFPTINASPLFNTEGQLARDSDEEIAITDAVHDDEADVNVYLIASSTLRKMISTGPDSWGISANDLGFAGKASLMNHGVIYVADYPPAQHPDIRWAMAHEIGHYVGGLLHSTTKTRFGGARNLGFLQNTDNERRLMVGTPGDKMDANPKMLIKYEWDKLHAFFAR